MLPDQDQFMEALYQRYFGKITSFVSATVHDPHIAQEIAQDTFHVAVLRIDELMAHPNPGGWLIQTAKYKIKEYQRRRSQDLRRLVPFETKHLEETPEAAAAFERAEASADGDPLEKVRQALTEEEYRLFQRFLLNGASHLEVAKELGISLSASYKRLERLRKKLRKIFQ